MKISAFQFRGSDNIQASLLALERGITAAARANARLLLTQECALCGYPPIEINEISKIDFEEPDSATAHIGELARKNSLYVALGTIQRVEDRYFNSIELITPAGQTVLPYHKRALRGWDAENFATGQNSGIYTIDNMKVGIRICYEVRFPEYFRELFTEGVEIALVSFCDVSHEENESRYEMIRSHLVTRAVENAMFCLSANSLSSLQTAPTCAINPDGIVLQSAPRNEEYLLTVEVERGESNMGRARRIKLSKELVGIL
ncbi:MAG TPA: carbon-nitrogen hydrolase family protein [Anaerolineae bacterium]|nr:carbon-nitrogen hydrolase family protein [Anaerolineae bacterium]